MNYLNDVIDPWLETLLASLPEHERSERKREVREKILESYRNGVAAGHKKRRGPENGR